MLWLARVFRFLTRFPLLLSPFSDILPNFLVVERGRGTLRLVLPLARGVGHDVIKILNFSAIQCKFNRCLKSLALGCHSSIPIYVHAEGALQRPLPVLSLFRNFNSVHICSASPGSSLQELSDIGETDERSVSLSCPYWLAFLLKWILEEVQQSSENFSWMLIGLLLVHGRREHVLCLQLDICLSSCQQHAF